MHLEFTYTKADIRELQKAHRKRARGKSLRRVLIWLILIVFGVVVYMVLQGAPPPAAPVAPAAAPTTSPSPLADLVVPLIPWLLIFLFIWFFVFRQIRANNSPWKLDPHFFDPRYIDIDNEWIMMTETLTRTQWKWDAFNAWIETTNLFLVPLKITNRYLILPKRAMTIEQQEEIRRLLSTHATGPIRGFPIIPPPIPR
jgi:hypothetical protein